MYEILFPQKSQILSFGLLVNFIMWFAYHSRYNNYNNYPDHSFRGPTDYFQNGFKKLTQNPLANIFLCFVWTSILIWKYRGILNNFSNNSKLFLRKSLLAIFFFLIIFQLQLRNSSKVFKRVDNFLRNIFTNVSFLFL